MTRTLGSLPPVLPIFPLTGVLLLPRGHLPLHIFEPRYRAMTEAALRTERMIGMVQPRAATSDSVADDADVYPTGCAGRIVSFAETDDGRFLITLRGVCRFAIVEELPLQEGFRRVRADFARYAGDLDASAPGGFDRDRLLDLVRRFLEVRQLGVDWDAINGASDEALVTALAMSCPFAPPEKQPLREAPTLAARGDLLTSIIEIALRDGEDQAPQVLQ